MDEVPLLVEYVTMLEIVGEVLVVLCIVVVVMKLVVSFVVVTEPCKNLEIVMAPMNFVANVAIVIIVDRKFFIPISFGIPTIVLIALVVWKRELVVVDNLWVCKVDLE